MTKLLSSTPNNLIFILLVSFFFLSNMFSSIRFILLRKRFQKFFFLILFLEKSSTQLFMRIFKKISLFFLPFPAPSAVVHVRAVNIRDTSALIVWDDPLLPNGKITNYQVRVSSGKGLTFTNTTTSRKMTLSALSPSASYNVKVSLDFKILLFAMNRTLTGHFRGVGMLNLNQSRLAPVHFHVCWLLAERE